MLKKIILSALAFGVGLSNLSHSAQKQLSVQAAELALNTGGALALGIRGVSIAGAAYAGYKTCISAQEAVEEPSKVTIGKTVAWAALGLVLLDSGKALSEIVAALSIAAAVGSVFTVEILRAFYSHY